MRKALQCIEEATYTPQLLIGLALLAGSKMHSKRTYFGVALIVLFVGSWVNAAPLTPIQKGTISIQLNPIATGMAAPLYGFSPPGDVSRLFVLEQNGLVRIMIAIIVVARRCAVDR